MPAVDLKVPYANKDAAKALGARWDADRKTWYAPAGARLEAFAEWMSADAWLAQSDPLVGRMKAVKKLSMSKGAVRSRAKKLAKGGQVDATAGRITIGVNYVEQVGAVGLPWAV